MARIYRETDERSHFITIISFFYCAKTAIDFAWKVSTVNKIIYCMDYGVC